MQKKTQSSGYSADSIQVLEGLEAVRKRPSMYIGDVGTRGLHHLVWEAVDNSIDEALAGYCNEITVHIHPSGGISVTDNGRGIPVGMHAKEKRSALEVVMTVLHAGGKFDKGTYKISGGLHGVGISCVNFLSSKFKVTVHRNHTTYEQNYEKGKPLHPVQEVGTTHKTGTTVYFEPDDTIFTTTTYQYDTIAARLRELAYLNPKIKLNLEDLRATSQENQIALIQKIEEEQATQEETKATSTQQESKPPKSATFYSEAGLTEFVTHLDSNRESLVAQPIYVEGNKNEVIVQVAFSYNTLFTENIASYVNNISTIEGGTHVAGFRRALTRVLKLYTEKSGLLERAKVTITGDDFREGLTAVIHVKVPEPQFEGQTKTKLGNKEALGAVDTCVSEVLQTYLEENPQTATTIIKKVILAAQARQAARKAREIVQRKSELSSTSLPGKLADCSEKDPALGEIFLPEGDSAAGTCKQCRDRKFQAILPIRGKILNIEKAQEHKMYDNEQIRNIITALGINFGTKEDSRAMDTSKLRYHKIIIMTDADVDGSHISILLLTFFFRYTPEIIQKGYLYLAQPPLFLVKKGTQAIYCWNEEERDQALKNFQQEGSKPNAILVQRYKGLGEMNSEQLWETTMDPEKRTLKQVTIESATEADYWFSILMGDTIAPRKSFIDKYATYANLDV
ncbi:MAG: DNA topoisomerase (ATP-hydrolyzing) subunit B [Bacteroidota bacterium]